MCRYCGTFDEAAADNGANVTLTESTVDAQVHANGSATWTVRNELDSAKPFRENSAALNATVQQLTEEGFGLPEELGRVQHRLDGETVVITFHTSDVAERRAGVLVVDLLHDEGREPRYVVNADRFTVRGPSSTVVSNTPESGTVGNGRVTWTGDSDQQYEAPSLDGSPYIAFGPNDTTATELQTAAALGVAAVVGLAAFLFPWSGYVEPLPLAVWTVFSTFALAALLPFGAAVAAGSRRWWAVPPVAFVIAVVALVDLTALPIGLGAGVRRIGLFVAAVVVPLVGATLALVGARLHDRRTTDAPAPDGSDGA